MNSNTGIVDQAGVLRMQRTLPADIERVWSYLIDPEKRACWLAGGSMSQQPGGTFELHFDHRRFTDETPPSRFSSCDAIPLQPGRLLDIDPPTRLTMLWDEGGGAESEVTFELQAMGDNRTVLWLTHRKLPNRTQIVRHTSGWHAHLDVLEDVLNQRSSSPFWSNFIALEAFYDRRIP